MLIQPWGVGTRKGDMRVRLVGEADKSRKKAGKGSGLLNGGRREKTRLECIECGPGERGQREHWK